MKAILDLLALIIFFAVYFITKDILIATLVAIVAGVFQATFIFIKDKKLSTIQIINLGLILVFGGATLLFKESMFIKLKPTILFWFVSAAMFFAVVTKRNFLQKIMGKEIELPENIWKNLTIIWGIFFLFLGTANLFVAKFFSDDVWVAYKVFGVISMMIIFFIGQGIYMAKHIKKIDS